MCDWPEPNFFSHRRPKVPAGDGKYSQKPVSMTSVEETRMDNGEAESKLDFIYTHPATPGNLQDQMI